MKSRLVLTPLFVLLLLLGTVLVAQGGYIFVKAQLAQWLIKDAWNASVKSKQAHKPWSWADTWPVAKLTLQGEQIFVLQGASLRVLAFGPGHLNQSSLPPEPGNTVILGHRDTHFSGLKDIAPGDPIGLQYMQGSMEYRVEQVEILHKDQISLVNAGDQQLLTLITCYPFDQLSANTPWRFVVIGRAV